MGDYPEEVLEFWELVKSEIGIEGDFQDAWGFGDTPELRDELLDLVLAGRKRATTPGIKEMEATGEKFPEVGDLHIILDGQGHPRAVIRTLDTKRARLCDVDEEHAFEEGEDDRTLESFLREHRIYFTRIGKEMGFEFSEDIEVIMEKFERVYPPEDSSGPQTTR
jgi:uncharacterized protein YhfF